MEDKLNQLRYSNKYTTLTRNELIQAVQSQMSQKRFQHVLGVEQAAVQLAEKYGASTEAASIAALTHEEGYRLLVNQGGTAGNYKYSSREFF